jgi:transcriptional regulator with XRE-family HTH domain
MPGSGSPTVRRRELGALLRDLRNGHGWTVDQVAEQLMVSPSKVSRLETGQRGASPRDIRDLSQLYNLNDEQRQQLMDLALEGRQRAFWQQKNVRSSTYIGLESEASLIRDAGIGLVPGLLQTADYSRAVLRAIRPELTEAEVEQRLSVRLQRQHLLTAPGSLIFQTVIDQAVLHRVVSPERVMRSQIEHLLEVSENPNVDIRVVPFSAGLLPSNTNKFIILSFDAPALPTIVYVEHMTADVYLEHAEDVEAYEATFSIMQEIAATPEETRDLFRAAAAALGDPN